MKEENLNGIWHDHEGNGHLHLSVMYDDEERVHFLLEHGCVANAGNNNEQSPLSFANFGNQVKLLLEQQSDYASSGRAGE